MLHIYIRTEGSPCVYTEHKQLLQINKKSDCSRETRTKPDRKVTAVIMQIKTYSFQLLIQDTKLWQCHVIPFQFCKKKAKRTGEQFENT